MPLADLRSYAELGDWSETARIIRNASPSEIEMARRWYSTQGENLDQRASQTPGVRSTFADRAAVRHMLAAALASTPTSASTEMAWNDWQWHATPEADVVIVEQLVLRGRAWCESFIAAACSLRVSRDRTDTPDRMARIILPLLDYFELEPPAGEGYGTSWVAHFSRLIAKAIHDSRRPEGQSPAKMDQVRVTAHGIVGLDEREMTSISLFDLVLEFRDPQAVLSSVFATRGSLADLFPARRDEGRWNFAVTIRRLTEVGVPARHDVVAWCLTALDRGDTPSNQRALTEVLLAMEITWADIVDELPRLQSIMAVAHGSVTSALLDMTLLCISRPYDMAELAGTIFTRTEKRQKSALLKALADPVEPFDSATRIAGLEIAVHADDLRLCRAAAAALAKLTGRRTHPNFAEGVEDLTGIWAARPQPKPPIRLDALEGTAAELTRIESSIASNSGSIDETRYAGAMTRFAWSDPHGARIWLATAPPRDRGDGLIARPMSEWVARTPSTPFAYAKRVDRERQLSAPRNASVPLSRAWGNYHRTSPLAALGRMVELESTSRLGSAPMMLSTPTLSTGTVLFDDLLERMRGLRDVGAAPLDFLLALLRLETVAPTRIDLLSGLVLHLDVGGHQSWFGARPVRLDAVAELRRWIVEGGGDFPDAEIVDGASWVRPAKVPIHPSILRLAPVGLFDGFAGRHANSNVWSEIYWSTSVGVMPHWPELTSLLFDHSLPSSKEFRLFVTWSVQEGHAGPGVHSLVARAISHSDVEARLAGVDAVLTLIGRNEFDQALFSSTCVRLLGLGELSLARTSVSFEHVARGGGMAAIWPTVLALLEFSAAQRPRPAGVSEVLGLVRRFVGGVPSVVLPEAIRQFASSATNSKSRAEARAVVSLMGQHA